ncbi:hypothetical protein WOLCODRAFT_136678 [Wolfiporia cocos MD-104 SS10]|uniref:Transcription factor CBF/NF-Y/archaeal histone domain-containing protein n=1 Tax=Wolfiporia cocos (strain MD-104) TaxID=742152 RepID=A0A2H3JD03_WOLCO|nr:hypothetical protein WOLCODRAFT_136678 [Wolfiporia cocos MD-104 SS10]
MALSSPPTASGFHPTQADADVEEEDEVDQLDSDLDGEDEIPIGTASSSNARPRRSGERVLGHTLIPSARLENIMHADGVGGHMSREAMYILSVATEEFIKRLATTGEQVANVERRSVVNYRDIAFATQRSPEFAFLRDVIPAPTTLMRALQLRAAREKELADDDPALAPPMPLPPLPPVNYSPLDPPPAPSHPPSAPPPSTENPQPPAQPRNKNRQLNGNGKEKAEKTEKTNGATSASISKRVRDSKGRWSQGAANGQGTANGQGAANSQGVANGEGARSPSGSVSAHASTRPSSARIRSRVSRVIEGRRSSSVSTNGLSGQHEASYPTQSPGDMMPPSASTHHLPQVDARTEHESWSITPHYTGPASAYLVNGEPPRPVFGHIGGMRNPPGRTIYSQQRPPNR